MSSAPLRSIDDYEHRVASHCETGSLRNLLAHAGVDVSEQLIFGIGSGPAFYYLFFARGPSGFPLLGIRNPPGGVWKTVSKLCGLDIENRRFKTTAAALARADELLAAGRPVAAVVDMFYMKYLPTFIQVHAPFHFIILIGKDGDHYLVSDPYSAAISRLHVDDLSAAWETNAPMARDNSLFHLRGVPERIDWKDAARRGILATCRALVLPPLVRNAFAFIGVQGIRTYAAKLRAWPTRYRGVMLREGILFDAVAFEDQGTGGGAFRLMYGAFLQEVGDRFAAPSFEELARQMIEHGQTWKEISRELIRLGKLIPMDDEAYADWSAANGAELQTGLDDVSRRFRERADFEQRFFGNLKRATAELR